MQEKGQPILHYFFLSFYMQKNEIRVILFVNFVKTNKLNTNGL